MAKLTLLALTFTTIVAFSIVSASRNTITTPTIDDNQIRSKDNGMVVAWEHLEDNPIRSNDNGMSWSIDHLEDNRIHSNDNGMVVVFDHLEDNRIRSNDNNGMVVAWDHLDNPITAHKNGMVVAWEGLDNAQEQCRSQVPTELLNQCRMHLNDRDIIYNTKLKMVVNHHEQHLQQCCSQLKNVSPQCQCDAIQKVFDEARQEGGLGDVRQIASKALRLPNYCGLEVKGCPLDFPRV